LGGTTSGSIIADGISGSIRGDRTWQVSEEVDDPSTPENDGVRIIIGAGTAHAEVLSDCTPSTTVIIPDDTAADFVLSCSSTTVRVNEGPVQVSAVDNGIEITFDVGPDQGVRYYIDTDGSPKATNLSELETLTVKVDGEKIIIEPQETHVVPEFPFSWVILVTSVATIVLFSRTKIINKSY